jgi:hypothetical protein
MGKKIIAAIAISIPLAAGVAVPVMSAGASSPVAAAPASFYHELPDSHDYVALFLPRVT